MSPAGWVVLIVMLCLTIVVLVLRWIERDQLRADLKRALDVVQDLRTARGFPERQRAALRADHLLRDAEMLDEAPVRAKELA